MDKKGETMPQPNADGLLETVLHDWHAANGGKMVAFGGWHMPVQYADGIIQEHLATRCRAGLFDVSHMGRFRLTGDGGKEFLRRALTNDAALLAPGEAQYTFIANENGGAVDDAYLYKLADADFLLVVNASNKDKDWRWLDDLNRDGAPITDISDQTAMIALQGPAAANILGQIVDPAALPENKRNRLAVIEIDGAPLIVARTGYTGEASCFELFPETGRAIDLWRRLVALGAEPIGLGARDSLRLEAGLPLYGHELGEDAEGREIPIFALALANFAVRAAGDTGFVGAEALALQRDEWQRIKLGEIDTPVEDRLLKRCIRPIAVFDGRRPLRAGQKVMIDGRLVGHVTSGTSVPYARAAPEDGHDMRPIGLALIDSDLRFSNAAPVVFDIVDDRGKSVRAELVERNLSPGATRR